MKSKFSYKSKRTIIIAAVITVLLAGTATGVYFFTKGNAQAQAAGDGNTTMQEEQHGEAPIENQSGEQTTTPSNNEQEETNQNQTGEQQTTEEQQENQEQTTNTQSTQNNQTTTTATTGEVPNQEYVTEREETIINPWETLTVGWGPTQFAPIVATANLNANKSNLTIAKIADKENVKTGDTITYTISVENTGDKVAKAIIYDNIPEGTVLLDKDNKEDENTKKLTWRVTVEPGKVEKVEFTVRVKSTEGTIKNAAIVNGKTTNETKTGVVNIKTTKISTPSATPLHEMDQITYTLTAKNSGDGEGIVKISDIVPQGTTLVENSIKLENKIYTEAELNEGIDVTLGGKEEKSITFTVTINPFKEEKIIIRNAEAKQDGENIPGTEDEVEKEYVSININKEFVDKENIDKYRPTEVLFGLYANENSNAIITTTTLNEQNNWKGSFTGLDKYDLETKALINYDVREIEVDKNYTPTYDSERKGNNITFNFTNILKYENVITSVTANKIWNDNEGKVGARTSVTFELYKDGEATGITQTASDSLKWKVTFQNLQKYHNDGTPIKYTVVEITKLEHYKEPSYTNIGSVLFVTNTIDYTTFSKDVKITKKWVDPANTEHSDITIDLYQSGNQNVFRTVTLKNGETEYTFTNLPKYDSEGNEYIYTAVEQNVEGYTTSYSDDKLTIINTINQENTVKVEGTKTWVDPQGTEHPTITINLLKNGTIEDVKTLENGTTTYSFENLPKYKTNDDGSYILDENGNVQLNEYSVREKTVRNYDTSYDGYNITNTFNQDIQGTIEITTTTPSQTSVKTPLDVVFVLDVSESMNDNDNDKKMVNAVNSAITTIMKENPDSRIGVVAYSSKEDSQYSNTENAITLLELGKYTPKTAGKYLTIQENVYYDYYWKEYYDTISTNVNEKNKTTINVYGGTFTQAGIKAGASILTNATTTYTTTVNGKEKTITRTPVMILLSDGDPTYYKTDFKGLTGSRQGSGSDTTENEAYYTIRTADYYKQQITSHYYGTTGTMSKFYTIGLNMSGTLSETILNPTKANLEKCNKEGTEIISHWWGTTTERNVKGKLYDKIKNDGDAGQYSYADKSYPGSMSSEDLQSIFNTIINDNSTSTETRDITLEESNARRVNLEGIDTSKEFKLTIESTTYNFETAQSNGYVKGNDTEGYYVDLTNVKKGTSITISYHK